MIRIIDKLCILMALITISIVVYSVSKPKVNVDLPEEYQLITEDTPIKGHFEGKTLVIEFNHHYK